MNSKRREECLKRIPELTLFDDIFMNAFFDGRCDLVQILLRTILKKDDLIVKEIHIQKILKNLQGHSSILDIYAVDSKGRVYDIEIQVTDKGASEKRSRFYSCVIDSNLLMPQEDYDSLPEKYVIFITANDVFGLGLPIYTVERHIVEADYARFNDGEHIIYVNGQYKGDDALGKLIHDLKCKDPKKCTMTRLPKELTISRAMKEVLKLCVR